MAAVLLPLLAFAGCAVDGARLYATQARLQQACDAGVLAGRKAMTDTSLTNLTLDATATLQANTFFRNNFRNGWFSATNVSFTPSKTAQAQVAGVARATVPMTLLAIFGMPQRDLNVRCEGRFDIADTDIIFVLDTTGSMACLPNDSTTTCNNYVNAAGTTTYTRPTNAAGGNDSMAGYPGTTAYFVPEKNGSRIAALRSAVLSFYDTIATNVDANTRVRYGFVTYTSTVNAGRAITSVSPSYMVGGAGNATTTVKYQTRIRNGSQSNGTPRWIYRQADIDVSDFVAGRTVTDPTKANGSTSRWDGCIEERNTTAGASTFVTSNLPGDLNTSLIPTSDATRWRPMWPDVIYARNNFGSTGEATSNGDSTSHPNRGTGELAKRGFVSCGKPIQRLRQMTRTQVETFVNAADFRPIGGTYHDVGMIWGTRLIDPTGIFASDTAPWPNRTAPNRVIVFLTDGDMAPNQQIYGLYGLEYYDRRITNGSLSSIKSFHNARFLAVCAKAKSMNIDVWTVTVGSAATTEMESCASRTAQALWTTSGTGLTTSFSTIARQVAMLRLSR